MKHLVIIVLFFSMSLGRAEASSDKLNECIKLNNEGVRAILKGEWQTALDDFEAALKIDPNYSLAKDNIAVTHGDHGLQLREKKELSEALWELHRAAFLNGYWDTELNTTVRMIGKNPTKFLDRVELGDSAISNGDYMGAVVEYRAALALKEDPQVRKKLNDAAQFSEEKGKRDPNSMYIEDGTMR